MSVVEEYAQKSSWACGCAKNTRNRRDSFAGLTLPAFAGIMFALVAMFLLPSTIVVDLPRSAAGLPVDMARTSHPVSLPAANREDALLVAVQRDGRIWFDRDQITPDQLPAKIRERLSYGAENRASKNIRRAVRVA